MLAVALILDAALGEPRWLWAHIRHPVVVLGNLVGGLDARLNSGSRRRAKGVVALIVLLVLALPLPIVLSLLPYGWIAEIVGGAILLAQRSLIEHVRAVADALERSLAEGRNAVSLIVGRDPETLDEPGVARAAIESAAENFSDGVVAPVFWFAIAGLPGIVAYKAVNTADSMIGHLDDRYRQFGWAAARVDDFLNWIPARISGYLILVVGGQLSSVRQMHLDAPKHKSPNAGWPEAAMALSIDVALAGPRVYAGQTTDDPFINPNSRRSAAPSDIVRSTIVLWRAWALLLLAAVAGVLTGFAF